jgi:hypothetical protein
LIDHRNAARVFPEPVGEAISVFRPSEMCAHPETWGAVGSPRFSENQRETRGWKLASGISRLAAQPITRR